MINYIKVACTGVLIFSIFGCASSQKVDPADESTISPNLEVPVEFEQYRNQYTGDPGAVSEGEEIYIERCESCHGEDGLGEGPMAKSLDPKPGSLVDGDLSDQYLFWRISEGGMMEPFNSVMPAWKTILTEDQIGKVIAYIHSLKTR
jgi:mono/diheme cytochrome c family protein